MQQGTGAGAFFHTAVVVSSNAELAQMLVPFVQDGVRRHEPVYVNLAADRMGALVQALGPDAQTVTWSETHDWTPHPWQRLRGILDLVESQREAGDHRLRFVGECAWPEGPPELVREWERFDSVLNHALAPFPVSMVCVYDAASLSHHILDYHEVTHPWIGLQAPRSSQDFVTAHEFLQQHAADRLPLPSGVRCLEGGISPTEARQVVGAFLAEDGTPRDRVDDMIMSVSEVVTNSLLAGASSVSVACWRTQDRVVAQVDDDGPGLRDALAGYRQPSPVSQTGRGLWIARQLADLVEIVPTSSGTSVRISLFDRHPALTTTTTHP